MLTCMSFAKLVRYSSLSAAWVSLTLAGCARSNERPIGYSLDVEAVEAPQGNAPKRKYKAVPRDAVMRAERGFSGKKLADGRFFPQAALLNELAKYDVICFGELHDQVEHHYAEYALLLGLARRTAASGRELGVGFEMFERGDNTELDSYVGGKLSEGEFLEQTHYEERWGFPFAFYEPLLDVARGSRLRALGLNTQHALIQKLAQGGFDALSRDERRSLPELDLEDTEHRAQFDAAMQHHPKGHGSPNNMYAAQVLWDETMAEAAAKWVSAHAPVRQLLIVAGRAHCSQSAIPARIKRRAAVSVVNITPTASDTAPKGYDLSLIFE